MKLAPLLSQYLLTKKELSLAGIGIFYMGENNQDEPEGRKQAAIHPGNISFTYNTAVKIDEDLVNYISEQTGKMKSLASADLESFLELTNQFLHIGKPFQLDGIGTLSKNNAGELQFTPLHKGVEKHKETASRELEATSSNEESFKGYTEMHRGVKNDGWKKFIVFLLLLSGIALAIWGGYWVYKSSNSEAVSENVITPGDIVPVEDSIALPPSLTDTAIAQPVETTSVPIKTGTYKFVLENADRNRAYERFNQLKSYFWKVYLETSDSVNYRIYMQLPATASDTARLKDSLTILTGKTVSIAK